MRIWLIQTGEPFPGKNVKKMRTAILADKLVERGHQVIWWTSAFDHFKKEWIYKEDTELTIKDGLKVIALKGFGYRKNISISRLIDHRVISHRFRKFANRIPKPDIIVTSTPPHDLAYAATMFGKKSNIPVLTDIRDPWPDIFLEHIPQKAQNAARMLLYKEFRMIKRTMKSSDGIIAVTNPLLNWGLKYAEREKSINDRVFYLGYKKPEAENFSEVKEKYSELMRTLAHKFIIFFVGAISRSYHNPSVLLKAAERLKENKDIHFIIAGDGDLFEELKSESNGLNNITLTGWLNQHEIEFWLKQSKIGVCPANQLIDLPTNKAYAYLSSGLPIISAFQGDLKELIEKYQMGFYYPPNNTDALVECIKKLYDNPDLYGKMSENAKKIFEEMFDAEKIYEEYADHIEKIIEKLKNK